MSFLLDNVLAKASAGLHTRGGTDHDAQRNTPKSRSHGAFLTPLVHLARDPVGALCSALDNDHNLSRTEVLGQDTDHTQILYLRMKNVGT